MSAKMMNCHYRILINSIDETGAIIVTNDGSCDIPVGARLTRVRRTHLVQIDGIVSETDLDVLTNLDLFILEVRWFNRSIDCIPRGHSAQIVLGGNLDSIRGNLGLCDKNEKCWLEA
jgi:hypothetical protein